MKSCLKIENSYLKTQTKHPFNISSLNIFTDEREAI